MPKFDRILQRLGDWLFSLRGTVDRLSQKRSEGAGLGLAATQTVKSVKSFDWSTFKSPRKLRKFLEAHPAIFIGVALLLILVSLLSVFRRVQPPAISRYSNDTEYFYDLSTGTVFVRLINGQTVADSPHGATLAHGEPAGVKAHVFSCGNCESESALFVGYLRVSGDERRIPTSQPAGEEEEEADGEGADRPPKTAGTMLIAKPPSSTVRLQTNVATASQPAPLRWLPSDSAEAKALMEAPRQRCGSSLHECSPLE